MSQLVSDSTESVDSGLQNFRILQGYEMVQDMDLNSSFSKIQVEVSFSVQT